mmetsp:Transcript_30700/g.73591  ORF Transcript_30700/g.73591 Transcript_30700/m.73591 type:complete len:229 (-) Transcript_30700:495-1181(-)
MATPWPPPMHRVASPFFAPRRCISCRRSTAIRAPLAPMGWPIAMAPPLTLTLAGSQPMPLFTLSACAAKASLASTRSRSSCFHPAFPSAAFTAGIGPVPMIFGSTPAAAKLTTVASGVNPAAFAASSDISSITAAPSLIPDADPAVTVPSFLNAGFSLAIPALEASFLMYSSVSKVPFFTGTGTIWALNLPSAWAAAALVCDCTANSSWAARSMPNSFATFSAVTPMW